MELTKRKYKKSQVEQLICQAKEEYAEKLNQNKDKIEELITLNKKLTAELNEYKEKEALINTAIVKAEQTAKEIEKTACQKYALEIENLRNFHFRFKGYFDYLMEKYPHYPAVTQAKELYDNLYGISISDFAEKDKIEKADESILFNKNEL